MIALVYPLIVLSGVLQAAGAAISAMLRQRLGNPWLAATVAFLPIVVVLTLLFLAMPLPLPKIAGLASIRWYDAFGGVAGSAAVLAGLLLADKVGSGPLNGLTVTGNILASLVLDSFGWLGLRRGGLHPLPWLGGLLMIGGVAAITAGGARGRDKEPGEGGLTGRLLYPFILGCGVLQAVGAALNAELRAAVTNPWLAADISFIAVASVFVFLFLLRPSPLPTAEQLARLEWWTPLAGLVGALAVFTGLLFIDRVGAGAFNGLLITANLSAAVALDHFGWLGMRRTPATPLRLAGLVVTVAGIGLIALTRRAGA